MSHADNTPRNVGAISENMNPADTAAYIGVSVSLLAKMRMDSDPRSGPPFARIGRVIIYRRSDVDEWLAAKVDAAKDLY